MEKNVDDYWPSAKKDAWGCEISGITEGSF